jgi:hypothetical protein
MDLLAHGAMQMSIEKSKMMKKRRSKEKGGRTLDHLRILGGCIWQANI